MVSPIQTSALVQRLLSSYCAARNLKLVNDPVGQAGYVETDSGERRFFRGCHFDLNPLGASEIADDKAYTLAFLKQDGFSVPDSLLVHSDDVISSLRLSKRDIASHMPSGRDAVEFAGHHGFPVFAKPNKGQEGKDVFRFEAKAGLEQGLADIMSRHSSVLVQTAIKGDDLRFLVLDQEVLCVLHRKPVSILGDGTSTVEDLAQNRTNLNLHDRRIDSELARQNVTRHSVPEIGKRVTLLPNTNLSAGAVAEDITHKVAPKLKAIAITACQSIGLRYGGVDLIAADPFEETEPYAILEINSAPGLNRYAAQGASEKEQVKAVYERVFDALTGSGT